ncbi:MAG TPA: phosphatidylglycerophosphatase A [Rhodopila sp.]|jgi:phosphatidylglycerophosphatase A|nr:phosphatidylglycerophosphatase A [Rhodopila sp.]
MIARGVATRIATGIAAGFGTGFAPVAAGTVASAVATGVGAALLWWSPLALLGASVLATFGGLWAVRAAQVEGDPGWVTIDEFAGQWIAMLGLATVTPIGLLGAFLLFRFLDVTKLGPVGWADRQHGAAGIMADDLIAGALAGGILWAVRSRWPGALG